MSELEKRVWRVMMAMVLLVAAAVMVGCAAFIDELEPPMMPTDTVTITWVRGVMEDCGGVQRPLGCAELGGDRCTITMPENAPDAIVAHEFRHCFQYRHKYE